MRFSTDWTRGVGRITARASIEVTTEADTARVRIVSLTLFDPLGRAQTVETGQVITLETEPAPLGGEWSAPSPAGAC